MKKQYYKESGLKFSFPSNWWVLRLDSHRFYHYFSGRGFKGVDFILLDKKGQTIFVEVKNYGNRFLGDDVNPIDALLESPATYGQGYLQKFEDSFQLVQIIHQYYQRKFWFRRIVAPLLEKYDFLKKLNTSFSFWWQLHQNIFVKKKNTRLYLWLELGGSMSSRQEEQLQSELQAVLNQSISSIGFPIKIINRNSQIPFSAEAE